MLTFKMYVPESLENSSRINALFKRNDREEPIMGTSHQKDNCEQVTTAEEPKDVCKTVQLSHKWDDFLANAPPWKE